MAAFAEEARWLGLGIAGLINIFDPELVVLGGFFGPILPLISEQLRGEIERTRLPRRGTFGSASWPASSAPMPGSSARLSSAFEPLIDNPLLVR